MRNYAKINAHWRCHPRPHVYVAGPITLGHRPLNIHLALKAADRVWAMGGVPVVPHVDELWDIVSPKHETHWLLYDLYLLERCDFMYVLEGESSGTENEITVALELQIPVFREGEEEALKDEIGKYNALYS